MKKTLKAFGIITVVICLIVSIVACDNKGTDDSVDVIAVSASQYASVEEALRGYVKEELAYSIDYSGEEESVVNANYVSHESKGAVAVDKIKLTEAEKENLVSAEKFAVKVQIGSLDKDSEEVFTDATQTVYILKYGDKYKFIVATPEIGERCTNSYVKMLTDFSKYENCTVSGVGMFKNYDDESPMFEEAIEYMITNEAFYKVSYYDEDRYNDRTPGIDENGSDRRSYILKNGNGIALVENRISDDKEIWVADNRYLDNYDTVKAYNEYIIANRVFNLYIPASIFTKTESGFECKILPSEGNEDIGWTTEVKMTVDGDKIIGTYMKESNAWTSKEDGKTNVKIMEENTTISAFGSTTVSVPTEVTEALKQLAE